MMGSGVRIPLAAPISPAAMQELLTKADPTHALNAQLLEITVRLAIVVTVAIVVFAAIVKLT